MRLSEAPLHLRRDDDGDTQHGGGQPSTEAAADVPQTPDVRGAAVDNVVVEIDYAIIDHFSSHIYASPNKAVEELVAHGFDAFAASVFVYVPGRFADDRLVVWGDGDSMGVEDLKRLWWIARSPKADGERRETEGASTRLIIGKFGIGKLASYAVGHRITHLAGGTTGSFASPSTTGACCAP